jgi:tetratricopeptide (TPR) repeat protein
MDSARRSFVHDVALAAVLVALSALPAHAAESDAARRGRELFEQGRLDEARAVLEPAAKAKPADAECAFLMGRIAMRKNDPKTAERWFEAAVEQDDRRGDYHLWLGRAYGQQAQRSSAVRKPFLARKTKAQFERAVQLDPEDLDARSDLISYYTEAPGFMGGSIEKAREQVAEIRRRSAYRGCFAAARVAESQKDWDAAEREYQDAAKAFPESLDVPIALGISRTRAERYDRAFEVFEGILATRPGEPAALYQIGRTAALSGQRLDRGEQALKEYLTLPASDSRPSPASAHWRLGMIHEKQGRKDLAREEYTAALALTPPQEEARKALARLR